MDNLSEWSLDTRDNSFWSIIHQNCLIENNAPFFTFFHLHGFHFNFNIVRHSPFRFCAGPWKLVLGLKFFLYFSLLPAAAGQHERGDSLLFPGQWHQLLHWHELSQPNSSVRFWVSLSLKKFKKWMRLITTHKKLILFVQRKYCLFNSI